MWIRSGSAEHYTGNHRDSIDRMFAGRHYSWQVGVKTEIPWGMRREKAEWARYKAALREQQFMGEKEGIETQ